MKTKSHFSLDTTVVFLIVVMAVATILSLDTTTLPVYSQNTSTPTPAQTLQSPTNQTVDPQQIKNYLNQAIQALDSGNNTRALEQVDFAEDQLESMTGTESAQDEDDDEGEEGEIEEGPGEDEDEPGDIDTNDEEDTP